MERGQETSSLKSRHRTFRARSIRSQLVLIPTVILLVGLLVTIGTVLLDAKGRIAAEVTSAMQLGHDLATTTLRNVANASSPALAFEQLAQDLPRVRHVQFRIIPVDSTLFEGSQVKIGETPSQPRPWLARLLAPSSVEQVFPVVVHGAVVGQVRLRSNSADEIAEIVGEVELFSAVLVALCLLIVAALLWSLRRLLHPVQHLAEGFNQLERGEYKPIQPIPVTELHRIGQQFNHLVDALHRVTADNHHLIDRLLSLQDEERKELAAELHDEFGPALFGIRAETACILKLVSDDKHSGTQIRAHGRAIAELTDSIQKLNYRMLDRLRPLVLEQMGLSHALRQLVATWQARYGHVAWSLEMPVGFQDPSEALSLVLYRAVQEAVTNTIRHARASAICIRLEGQATASQKEDPRATGAQIIFLSITDNGQGLPPDVHYGFGLLGMMERVRQQGGIALISNAMPTGVVVQIRIPVEQRITCMEPLHADSAD